jgi:hypothetical protein
MPIPPSGSFDEQARRSMLEATHLDGDNEQEAIKAASMFFKLLGD